ncbi:tetratricopeptide repeat protein [Bacteroidota bacterium]
MKKIIFLLLFAFSVTPVFCQKAKVQSAINYSKLQYNELDKAKEAIDLASVHENTINWYKTWYTRGEVYLKIFNTKERKFLNLSKNPLEESYLAFKKSLELDEKGRSKEDVYARLPGLSSQFYNNGVILFEKAHNEKQQNNEDKSTELFKESLKSFEYCLEINEMPFIARIDTSCMFNAALSADRAKLYDKALLYYHKVADLGYEGSGDEGPYIYFYMYNIYQIKGDTLASIEIIKKGIEAFPENNVELIKQLTSYYLTAKKTDESFTYIQLAIEKDPGNKSLHFALGHLYDKRGEFEKSLESYQEAINIDPEFSDALFNYGILCYNRAIAEHQKANEIQDNTEYEKAIEYANSFFKMALPYLENAHEIQPKDFYTIDALKNIYYRFQMDDKRIEMEKKLNELK